MPITVYILRCADSSYYTGITKRPVKERVAEHNSGLVTGYTHSRLPVELVCAELFDRIDEAIARERQVKGWSRRKKEALIGGDYVELPKLASRAKSKQGSS